MIVRWRKIKSFVMLRCYCCFLNSFPHPLTLHDAKFIASHLSFSVATPNVAHCAYTRLTDIVVIIVAAVVLVCILSFLNKFRCVGVFHLSLRSISCCFWSLTNIQYLHKTLVSHLSKCRSGSQTQFNECQEVERKKWHGTPAQVKHCDVQSS